MPRIAPLPKTRERSELTAGPIYSVVAVYDDFSSGIRAKEALEWLEHSLNSNMDFRSTVWSFRSLERQDVRANSLREAATADVLIIAASEMETVPDQIKIWIDSIFQHQRDGRAVLVALHDGDEGPCASPGPLCSYLEHQAGRWHTEFMCNHDFDLRLDRDYAIKFVSQKGPARYL